MKTLATFIIVLVALCGIAIAQEEYTATTVNSEKEKAPEVFCPKTKISDNNLCLKCHVLTKNGFALIETPIESGYTAKPFGLDVIQEKKDGPPVGYVKIIDINHEWFKDITQYIEVHPEIQKLIVEIHSPGGSVMDAWRIVGYIDELRSRGIEIETKCYGYAASAGFMLFVSGDIGKRFVSPWAELMTHKVWTFGMFHIANPDTSEDETNLLKHFQTNINNFILTRVNQDAITPMTREMIEDNTYKRDWWVTGKEAVDLGVADGFVKN